MLQETETPQRLIQSASSRNRKDREHCGENHSESRWGQSEPVQRCSHLGNGLRGGPQPWPDLLASGRHRHRYPLPAALDSTAIARMGHSIYWFSNNWPATGAEINASEHSDSSVFIFWTWYWIGLRHGPHTSCIAQAQKRLVLHLVKLHRAEETLTPFNT